MSRVSASLPLVPSVLDRLLDDDLGASDTTKLRYQVLQEMKASLKRDLEDLLNTRWRCRQWPPELSQLDVSLINYGIPDFTGVSFATEERKLELLQIIETVIKNYEPRLSDVHVELAEKDSWDDRTCRFRIRAVLLVEPVPEPVVFETEMQPVTTDFVVKGSGA